MSDNKKSAQFLPSYLQTDKNKKFLSSTIDQFIQSPKLERIDGYVGTKITPNFNPVTDTYISESSSIRSHYQLEPAAIFRDSISNITDVVALDDLINEIYNQGGNNSNIDRIFRSQFYSFDPLIDWDKLINYDQYYWLPVGPDSITISTSTNVFTNIIGASNYIMPNGFALSNGMKVVFTATYISGSETISQDKEYIVEGVGSSIRLVDFSLLEPNGAIASIYNETFDSDGFDQYGFDSDARLALTPEYITINKSSKDLNPWSRYNRWFHKDVIELTAQINNTTASFDYNFRAKRPIIEFKPNIQLYNFGKISTKNVDVIDNSTEFPLETINNQLGYYIDGVLIKQGWRVIFNNDNNINNRNKIYVVSFAPVTGLISLVETADSGVSDLTSVSVNYGNLYTGKSFYYSEIDKQWVMSQQHEQLNQPPLFDLCDNQGDSFKNNFFENDFSGNKIFGYKVGTGVNDSVLGFPISSEISGAGVGSYVFKNYFSTDSFNIIENNVSSVKKTATTFLRKNNFNNDGFELVNVWRDKADYRIPIIETLVANKTTTTIEVSCFNKPISNIIAHSASVNYKFASSTATLLNDTLKISFDSEIHANDSIVLKIISDQAPNDNGYYEPPIGATNNPLNETISEITYSQLSDHVSSMVDRDTRFIGEFPGEGNLRDIDDYAKFGTRLILNENPLCFSNIFLGKKQHNVIDSLRFVCNQYNQWKLNFLREVDNVVNQTDLSGSLDEVIAELNRNSTVRESFYRSDMIGYGTSKTVRSFTVASTNVVEYPLGIDFDLESLSYRAVYVYKNLELLIYGKDYTFNSISGTVILLLSLSSGDKIEFHVYNSTLGNFIPFTPSKLGIFPKFEPAIIMDDRYADDPVQMIRGHDGSLIRAYGDYRDDIILELEKRIYNNIKVEYNRRLFDIKSLEPGYFRQSQYSKDEINDILLTEYGKWASVYNINITKNDTYEPGNYRTYNWKGQLDETLLSGTWRGIFKFLYDTDRPHSHPWEMLGFSDKPNWWEDYYGTAPYTSSNTFMWDDIENGYIRYGPFAGVWEKYKRPGLANIIPVTSTGQLNESIIFLISGSTVATEKADWVFGDYSPAEMAWRNSSYYPFALNIAGVLLNPSSYLSKLYDVSRIHLNILDQVVYSDELYLNPKKLLVEGYNTEQIAGYGNFVIERGIKNYQDYRVQLAQDLNYFDINLFHKLGGFTSKEKLQVRINAVDPQSTKPGFILPMEDYSLILNTSNPIRSARISGVVVQKVSNGYMIKGYDRSFPHFHYLTPVRDSVSKAIVIGGKEEPYTVWKPNYSDGNSGLSSIDTAVAETYTTKFYKQGQIVFYNNKYYRVTVSHNATKTFISDYFSQMPGLPTKGGVRVLTTRKFGKQVSRIPYGTVFLSTQEVYDFLIGYGAWLETQGFIFDTQNSDLVETMDWYFSAKEFLYWSTQNWANGNLIVLSPFVDYLKYSYANSVVDNMLSNEYEYSLQKADGKAFPVENFDISRQDGYCVITTKDTEEGLFFAVLNSVQKEHGMVFNNTTIFNDTIYDSASGYRQKRIKLTGFRTKDWNGDVSSPGFVYDNVNITDWKQYRKYQVGDLVRYNSIYYTANQAILNDSTFDYNKWNQLTKKPASQLLPNFDYKISQFEDFYSLDIDNFDEMQQSLAQRITGYTSRNYLEKIIGNSVSEYKFYQGLIKDKGTKKALDNILKVSATREDSSIELHEEWAFRVGSYGSFETFKEIEITLNEGIFLENPYVIKFGKDVPTESLSLVHYTSATDILISPVDFNSTQTFITIDGTFNNNATKLLTAGYVRPDDVDTTAYNKNSLLDIANNGLIPNNTTVWVGFLENGDWTVYRYLDQRAKITGVYVSSPGSEITFVTDVHHNLSIGDMVSVVRFNHQVNGVYIVESIPSLTQFTVKSLLSTIVNEPLLVYGTLFKFENARFSNYQDLSNATDLFNVPYNSKLWVDKDENNKWAVFQKIKNYSTATEFSSYVTPINQELGACVLSKGNVLLASSPNYHEQGSASFGKVQVYRKFTSENVLARFDYVLNSNGKIYCQIGTGTDFGYSLEYDINKDLFVVGAPDASLLRSTTSTSVLIPVVGNEFPGRSSRKEGIVKISTRNSRNTGEVTLLTLSQPYNSSLNENSRFGHSLYVNQVSADSTSTLLVGAPGNISFQGEGTVFAYKISGVGTSTAVSTFFSSSILVQGTSTVTLNPGSRWGYVIAGSASGDTIAISAPGYGTYGKTGVVQLFDQNLSWKQTLYSPFNDNDEYGYSLDVSKTGKYIFVGSKKSLNGPLTKGKVAVYTKKDSGQYSLTQIILNPLSNTDLVFAEKISISPDETTLAISSLGTNRSETVEFFQNTTLRSGQTTFDNNQTRFVTSISDSGAVYTYNNFNGTFVASDELLPEDLIVGGKYGSSISVTDNSIFVGAPFNTLSVTATNNSRFYQFKKIDSSISTWKKLRYQEPLVDVSTFNRIALIDTSKDQVIEYLDIFDPLKNKLPGIVEQELDYRVVSDPAIYSIGISSTIVDTETNWLDEHVGELWWDLSTSKYVWYEQGSELFRKNNWGRLFPGASIDVYEWVKSDLLPSEWSVQADTSYGLSKGISGQPKYPDNSVVSVKQVLNTVTGSFENVYYFWVKNKVTLPKIKNRRTTAAEVSKYIANPLGQGLEFVEIISKNAVAFANVQGQLVDNRISANIAFDTIKSEIPKHTEWMLIHEGDSSTVLHESLNKKLIDSLIGRDEDGRIVPDPSLSFRNRYGLGIRPQQTLFKDRFEALRNVLGYANSILSQTQITGIYDLSKLNSFESIPDESLCEYDTIVDNYQQLLDLVTVDFVNAELSCVTTNGKIVGVSVVNPGYGYQLPPKVSISPSNGAEIKTEIDSNGRVVSAYIVNSGNSFISSPVLTVRPHSVIVAVDQNSKDRWAQYSYNYNLNSWYKVRTQIFNTTLYWDYIDWVSNDFDEVKPVTYIIDSSLELDFLTGLNTGDYVRILNSGDGNQAIVEKLDNDSFGNFKFNYNIVFKENGTIRFKDILWNSESSKVSYDRLSFDETLYDQLPDTEISNILFCLKDNIFVNSLKGHWNSLFFKAVKYALTEQKLLDWAFKTSFVKVKNNTQKLEQKSVYQLDNNEFYENYVREIKPYHTNIRNFVGSYGNIENAGLLTTDFDLIPYYNDSLDRIDTVSSLSNPKLNEYPWKSWYDNHTYKVKDIIVGSGGEGYTSRPAVQIIGGNPAIPAQAEAYLRNGKVYKIVVTNPGRGYLSYPTISIASPANADNVATASVVLENDTVRKNIITMKFDRYSRRSEIGDLTVDFSTVTDGINTEYELPYLANPDELLTSATLDKKLVLSADYKIVYFSKDDNGYKKNYSKFVFVNYLPKPGKTLRVIYQKSINLFNAIDRINNYYNPTAVMPGKHLPLLIKGLEYPKAHLKGLEFNYSTPIMGFGQLSTLPEDWYNYTAEQKVGWFNLNNITPTVLRNYGGLDEILPYLEQYGYMYADELINGSKSGNIYDMGGFNDYISDYARARIISTASISTTTLYLNTTTGIVPGQVLNFLNTDRLKVRTDTVVVSVNPSLNSIQISSPLYKIVRAIATSTVTGSNISFQTSIPFYGTLRKGDLIEISGITTSGFNGLYTINSTTNNVFTVISTQTLASVEGVIPYNTVTNISSASVRAYSLLETIEPRQRLIGDYNFFVGPCIFPKFTITGSPSIMEGYTATFTISGTDVFYGNGRTFAYKLSGQVTDSDFTAGSTSTWTVISTTTNSLPISFITTATTSTVENPETAIISIASWLTTATANYKVLASMPFVVRDKPLGSPVYYIRTYNQDGTLITTASEGDVIRVEVTGTNIDFGSDGRIFRVISSGSYITSADIVSGQIITEGILAYSQDDFPLIFNIGMAEDLTTEYTENITFRLGTYLNVWENTYTGFSTSTELSILDTSVTPPATYSLTASPNVVFEGTSTDITLTTTNLPVGTVVPFTISTVSGTISLADLTTSSYTGSFVMTQGATGYQVSTATFAINADGAFEGNEVFRLMLTNHTSTYVDVTIADQINNSFGQYQSKVYSFANNSAQAFGRVKILTNGGFEFEKLEGADADASSLIELVPDPQYWTNNPSGTSGYYVRARIDPTSSWTGDVKFTGPGFVSTVTNLTAPQQGNWVSISSAASTPVNGQLGWYASAQYSSSNASAGFNLVLEIKESSGSTTVISVGTYSMYVSSVATAVTPVGGAGVIDIVFGGNTDLNTQFNLEDFTNIGFQSGL